MGLIAGWRDFAGATGVVGVDTSPRVDQSHGFGIFWPASPVLAGNGADLVVPFGTTPSYVVDPLGMLQAGTYVSSYHSGTFTKNQWFRLPPGLWLAQLTLNWDGNTVGSRECYFSYIDDRTNQPLHPFWTYPEYTATLVLSTGGQSAAIQLASSLATTFYPGQQIINTLIAVSPAMVAASDAKSPAGSGWACAAFYRQDSGGTRTISNPSLYVVKLGEIE